MIRGTTAPFRIKLPYAINELEWVTIKWWQDGNKGTPLAPLPITKKRDNCSVVNDDSKELYVTLTAEETIRFSDKHKAKMQLRGKLSSNGRIFGCKPRLITVYPINDDLFGDDITGSENNDGWIVLDGDSIANEQEVTRNG